MKITHYLYNAFIIEMNDKKIAIDPGALFAYYFSFASLIPKKEWKDITHVFVTHGDPDHYWHADRVAWASGAPLIFNRAMVKECNGTKQILGPRSKGLAFDTSIQDYVTLVVGEKIKVDGMTIAGIKAKHGPLTIKIGPFKKTETPGPEERIGRGDMGFEICYQGTSIINLADTLLLPDAWKGLASPDVLMIPIGGKSVGNTMDEVEALEAVRIIKPGLVIPTHYNCPMLFSKRGNPAHASWFKAEVEQLGFECCILGKGGSLTM
jgi:L-ascorbate metabolism protein UlaG (beta-lactamase superfamily)